MARERRTKFQIVTDDIKRIENKIHDYEEKILALNETKEKLVQQLQEITEQERKAKEAAEVKEVLKMIKSSGLSMEEIKNRLLNNQETAILEQQ